MGRPLLGPTWVIGTESRCIHPCHLSYLMFLG